MNSKILLFIFFTLLISCSKNESPVENNYESENHISSNFKLNEVELSAKSEDSELRLKLIKSEDVNFNGYSEYWQFKYSTHLDNSVNSKYFYVSSYYDTIKSDSTVIRESTVGDAFISQNWLNSNEIMIIAEKNGGKEFRNENPTNKISALLSEAVIPDSKPIWTIKYLSLVDENKSFLIRINGVTGIIEN